MSCMPTEILDVFLASSITEFHMERLELGNFVRELNDILLEKGIYCRLCLCEDVSDEIAMTRKQDEYNERICTSDYCFVLFGQQVGEYTREELEIARKAGRKNGRPEVAVFFRPGPDGMSKAAGTLKERLAREKLRSLSEFTHIDEIKFSLLQILSQDVDGFGAVEIRDGAVWLDGVFLDEIDPGHIPG